VFVKDLSLLNFKNYEEAQLEFSSEVNCLVGDNGSGKTNILDAIHYLSFCKSYFNQIDSQNVRHDEPFFVIQSRIELDGETDDLYCGVKKGSKKVFKRNDKDYSRLADHIGRYPAVIITPNDIDLIKEGSEFRRNWVNSIISQYNRRYLDDMLAYNKALKHRNNLLKYFAAERTFDADTLAVWDEKVCELGVRIQAERLGFVDQFTPIFSEFYTRISGGKEVGTVGYKTNFEPENYSQLMIDSLPKDRVLQRTSVGPHKDDFVFKMDDYALKKYGSQGQQKSFLIALKLAQFQFVRDAKGVMPFLLLDDVFDKIDDQRVACLMELVSENRFGQIFITDTHQGRVPKLFQEAQKEVRIIQVDQGKIAEIEGVES
jgi:DNA replication and repair protein RecF